MSEYIERVDYRGYIIRIVDDGNGWNESPREWSTSTKMYCWHRRRTIGDIHGYSSPSDMRLELIQDIHPNFPVDHLDTDHAAAILDKHYEILPIYMYDHSGITISTSPFSCGWDSGQAGVIIYPLSQAQKDWSVPEDQLHLGWDAEVTSRDGTVSKLRDVAKKSLEHDVAIYDCYLRGDIAGCIVKDKDGEEISADWGYYPNTDAKTGERWHYVIEKAKGIVDGDIASKEREAADVAEVSCELGVAI